jgi:ANTAR domain
MAWLGSQFSTELESHLREGLSTLQAVATGMGASSASVFLVKDGRTMRNLYMWPESGQERAEVVLERPLANALQNSAGYASQNSPAARFLQRAFQPESTSFFLSSWGTDRLSSVIALGFAAASTPQDIGTGEIPCEVGLASLAAWSVYEVFRLHSELAVVNDRLGARKLIERAKGILQAERGFDEQQAYAHLRKLSRQRRVRLSQVATDLLATWRFP